MIKQAAKEATYLQSKAALEAMLQNPALSETEKARIREEAKTKGLAAHNPTRIKKTPKEPCLWGHIG